MQIPIGEGMATPLKGFLSVLDSTCRLVVCVIPPLLGVGLIDRTGCVVLGAAIGIVVAIRSMQIDADRHGDET